MLTRAEILEALRKMGYREARELKRLCRSYERYAQTLRRIPPVSPPEAPFQPLATPQEAP